MKRIALYSLLMLIANACILFEKQTQTNTNTEPQETNTQSNNELFTWRQMSCTERVLENGDSLHIFLEMEIPRLMKTDGVKSILSDFTFSYGLLASYTSKEFVDTRKLTFNENQVKKQGNFYYVDFKIEKRTIISAVMILDIVDAKSGQKILHDILLNYTVTKVREKFSLFDKKGNLPYFSNYFLVNDTLQIKNLANSTEKLFVKRFSDELGMASPPMSLNTSGNLPKNLQADSMFVIPTNTPLKFDKKGLYFIQQDTTQYYGLSFYVGERKFPKLSIIKDVIEPLRYITTDEEIKILEASKEPKKELDKLWLKWMAGSTKLAKQTIKEYYNRVKLANKFFTTFKEGWKTDMGMIFIIYGSPNRTIRTNDAEYWFYTQNANFAEMKFTFLKKPNQFTDESYYLTRFPDYEQIWYPMIELWRAGKI